MNKATANHLERKAALGCIVCRNQGYGYTPAEIHHIRHGAGMSQRNGHYVSIPLCPDHHRLGGHGVAIHAGKQQFEMLYGNELQLLDQVGELLES
jgi:hypothetical protein